VDFKSVSNIMMTHRPLLLFCWRFFLLLEYSSSFSIGSAQSKNLDRRTALANILSIPTVATTLTSKPRVAASALTDPSNVCTVVVDSPDTSNIGIQFVDATIGSKEVASAEKVDPDSLAAKSGVKPGMVLLGRDSATKSSSKNIEFRLRNGPFPFILQFATPEEMMKLTSSNSGQQQVQERALGPYDRLDVKTVQTPNTCDNKAKTGDTVTISYEARISTATGPIYDSTAWRQSDPATFVLGKGVALPGVEIGLNGMCVGEVREIDIPTSLGYGKFGSQVFDVPGDVRLWWRVELLDLTKNQKKFRLF
jgi:hypothetical protein